MIKITTRRVIEEFERRGIPLEIITEKPYALMRYKLNGEWHLLHSTMPEYSAASGKIICDQKGMATELARQNDIPVPLTVRADDEAALADFLGRFESFVVKPADGAHGRGVTVGATKQTMATAIELAAQFAGPGGVILQQRVSGSDLRILVIGGRMVAVSRRIPAGVVGDGERTLRQLIDNENETNPERGYDDEKRFSKISLESAERFLGEELDSRIPAAGEQVTVVGTANIGAGGYAIDYTDQIAPEIQQAAEKFARLVSIAVCGVDFMWDEQSGEYYFIEANACPGFNLHIQPTEGKSRPVNRYFVDFLMAQKGLVWKGSER
jgi:cyanophycin synthetase